MEKQGTLHQAIAAAEAEAAQRRQRERQKERQRGLQTDMHHPSRLPRILTRHANEKISRPFQHSQTGTQQPRHKDLDHSTTM